MTKSKMDYGFGTTFPAQTQAYLPESATEIDELYDHSVGKPYPFDELG